MNTTKKPKDASQSVGLEIRKRLLELGMTQRELAEQVGASEEYIWHITHGRRKGTKYMPKILCVLEIEQSHPLRREVV